MSSLKATEVSVMSTRECASTNERAKVYFGSIQHGKAHASAGLAAKLDRILELLDFSTIQKKDKVAIKMHLGFDDGYQTVPVFFVRRIVKAIKQTGGWPFVTDNPTAVYNAVDRGYTQETCGCPLIPATGVKDGYVKTVNIGYRNAETLEMSGVLHDADALVDLTHAKGHGTSGYGGAIKNLGIGGYAAKSRWEKLHGVENSIRYWDPERCTPEHAQNLVKSCPYGAIHYDSEKHQLKVDLYSCKNQNCLACLKADEQVGSLQIKPEFFAAFQELVVIATKKVLDTFDRDKRFFLNFALEITSECDCLGMPQPCVVPDIGILGSRDIVAVETATLDMIARAGLMEKEIPPSMKCVNLDPNARLHPFERIWGAMKSPYIATTFAEKQGLGTTNYELVEVLSPEEVAKMPETKQEYERKPSFF